MSKCKVHEFDPQIYPRKLWVVKGGDVNSLKDMFAQANEEELQLSDVDAHAALTYSVMMKDKSKLLGELIYFCSSKFMDAEKTTHEAVHAALDIFSDMGCMVDYDNQEPFAYLVGWIADCIDQVKRNKFKD